MFFNFFKKSKRTRSSRSPRPTRARLGIENLESRLVPYAISGNAWMHPELVTLSFVPDGTIVGSNSEGYITSNLFATMDARFGSTAAWQNQILRAAQVWAQQTNLNLAVVNDNGAEIGSGDYQQGDPAHGDIRIGGFNMGTAANSPLGQAFMPPPANNYDIAGDFQFNTGKTFSIGSGFDLFTVAVHEFGHTFGLNHSNLITASMYANYNGVDANLNADDIKGIRQIYSGGELIPRSADLYDAVLSNGLFVTATSLTSLINTTDLTALATGLDLTAATDADFYTFVAPLEATSTLTLTVQSQGLSLLSPKVEVYAADMTTLLGSASAFGEYDGATLTLTIANVTPLDVFYVKVSGAETQTGSWQAFNTGQYALTLNFGTGPSPDVPLPDTQTLNDPDPSGGGGEPIKDMFVTEVNEYVSGTQATFEESPQAVALDGNGNYVVVWSSQYQDGSGYGIYARRFAANGTPLGSEFRVNTTTANDQKYGTVAMNSAGAFVITWSSNDQDGGGWGVYAQRYDAAGVAQGSEFRVNNYTANDQMYSTAAMDDAGNFVITWSSNGQDGSGWGVYARRYNADGMAQANAFKVNGYNASDQTYATIAMNHVGNFVISWSSNGQDGSGWGVYARRYHAAGTAQTNAFKVNTWTTDYQQLSAVAMDSLGNFVVTWSSKNQDGDGWGSYAQRYNAAGVKQGSEFRVNNTTRNDQKRSSVGMDANGNFMITWQSQNQDGSGWGIYGRQFNAAGVALDDEFLVNTTSTSGDQVNCSIAMDKKGNAVVVWSGAGAGDKSGVWAQFYELAEEHH